MLGLKTTAAGRPASVDLRPVAHVIGLLLCGLAAALGLPAVVDALDANPDWQVFARAGLITGFVGVLLALATWRDGPFSLDLRQAFVLTTGAWLVLSAAAAVPFLGLGLSYTDAFFETVSGVTTTGSTVIVGLDTLPPGILLWRSLLQWVGGVGIIVMAIVLLPFLRIGGMQLFQLESSDTSERAVPRSFSMIATITGIYVLLSVACTVGYVLSGMTLFDAVNHAMTTLSTGGYSTHDASMGFFRGPAVHWVGAVFMALGAIPFMVHLRAMRGDARAFWRDSQTRAFVGLLVFASLVLGGWDAWMRDVPVLDALRHATFNVVSVVTTTGFASEDYSAWGPPALGAFLVLTFIGGCTGSTTGAIKIYRFQILWIVTRAHLKRLSSPHRVLPLTYQGRRVPEDVPLSVLAFLTAFLGTVGIFTVVLAFMGLDLDTALTSAATALTNVGPGLGPVVGPAGNFATLPDGAKWVLAIAMLLGRLELFTMLVLFDRGFWRG